MGMNYTYHEIYQTICWTIIAHCGLWGIYFKHTKVGFYLHAICFTIATLMTLATVSPLLILHGLSFISIFGNKDDPVGLSHNISGFSVFVLSICALFAGIATKMNQISPKVPTEKVLTITFFHKLFGYIILICSRVAMIVRWNEKNNKPILFSLIALDIISFGIFFYKKFFPDTVQEEIIKPESPSDLRRIKSSEDLKIYSNNFVIFSDYVYSTEEVINWHPGGYEIIKNAKGRQIDRYLYGVEPLQLIGRSSLHAHSTKSFSLLGEPIAKMENISIYEGMEDLNECQVLRFRRIEDSSLYVVRLKLLNEKIRYQGYTTLSQLGRYYSLTIDHKTTRLYTGVNFLRRQNIVLISKAAGLYLGDQQGLSGSIQDLERSIEPNQIPLLMKKYDEGALTSKFLSQDFSENPMLSQPKGRGLDLQDQKPGKIIFFVGGTGLNPICDLIDLLYKGQLVKKKHKLSNEIAKNDPIMYNPELFDRFQFSFFISLDNISELNLLTRFQCQELIENGIIECTLKIIKDVRKQDYRRFSFIEENFEQIVKEKVDERLSKIYLCGPTRMSKAILDKLTEMQVNPEKYLIL